MEKICWKEGAQFPVKAEVAAENITNLQKSLGKDNITAQELLDASRDENAPLHCCFEWNDTIAAEQWRKYQARHLIGSIVRVTYIEDEQPPTITRVFVNVKPVKPKEEGAFVLIDTAICNKTYREQILENALRELQNFQRKYRSYTELSGVFNAIDSFGDTLK